MSDKPLTATLPQWAHTGAAPAANIEEPTLGKKQVGWDNGEQPPASTFNWILVNAYLWLRWLDDGAFTRPSLTDNTLVISFTDQLANVRNYVDPHGYFFGPAIQEHYRWNGLGVTPSQTDVIVSDNAGALAGTTDANCRINSVVPNGSLQRRLQVRCDNAAVNQTANLHSGSGTVSHLLFGNVDDVVAVAEYRLHVEAVGANNVDIHHGFNSDPDEVLVALEDPTANSFVMFEKLSADTNWFCTIGDNTAGSRVDSGVPPVAGVFQTFRVEFMGVNTPQGPRARFFIDGAEVAEIITTVPTVDAMGLVWRNRADGTGPAADLDVTVEDGVKAAWNMVLSPDVPA